jgi:hypothetical protein
MAAHSASAVDVSLVTSYAARGGMLSSDGRGSAWRGQKNSASHRRVAARACYRRIHIGRRLRLCMALSETDGNENSVLRAAARGWRGIKAGASGARAAAARNGQALVAGERLAYAAGNMRAWLVGSALGRTSSATRHTALARRR